MRPYRSRYTIVLAITALLMLLSFACASNGSSIDNSSATTRFVDNGPDSGCSDDGTGSKGEPWCTLAPLAETGNLNPGDRLLLRRGRTWKLAHEPIQQSGSGSPDAPITIGAYGPPEQGSPHLAGPSGAAAIVLVDASWWRIHDLEISDADTAIQLAVSDPSARSEHLHLARLYLHDNRDGIASYAERVQFHDLRIEDIEAHSNGSDTLEPPPSELCPQSAENTAYGQTLTLLGADDVVVNRANIHDDKDGAIKLGMETSDVTIVNSRIEREASSFSACGSTAAYLTDVARIAFVNDVFARTVNSGSGDQSGMDADTDVDGLTIRGSAFIENSGPGLELLQNSESESDAPQDVTIEDNLFTDNATDQPAGVRGGILVGWASPLKQVPASGVIRGNVTFEPTGFMQVYEEGEQFGFKRFEIDHNQELASREDAFLTTTGFQCSEPAPADQLGRWSYEMSDDGDAWKALDHCTPFSTTDERWLPESGDGPWVSRYEQMPFPTPSSRIARVWTAPRDGSISIRGRVVMSDAGPGGCHGDGVAAEISVDGATEPLFQGAVPHDLTGIATNVDDLPVTAGDAVRFVVRSTGNGECERTSWAPLVSYP